MHQLSVARTYQAFILVGLLATGLWMELDQFGPLLYLPLIALFYLLCLPWPQTLARPSGFEWRFPPAPRQKALSIAASLIAVLPILIYLIGTLKQEFPFRGDHDHHVYASLAGVRFWKVNFFLLAFVLQVFLKFFES